MFGKLIDGSQNAVWRLAFEGEIPQNNENHSRRGGLFVTSESRKSLPFPFAMRITSDGVQIRCNSPLGLYVLEGSLRSATRR